MPVFRKIKEGIGQWLDSLQNTLKDTFLVICAVLLIVLCFSLQQKAYEATERLHGAIHTSSVITSGKTAYLTFDDGPSSNTRKVLDILKEEGVPATFFIIGSQVTPEREDLLREMVEEGHSIGIHTYTHQKQEIYKSTEGYLEDLKKTADRINEVTGISPRILRFPYGSNNQYMKDISNEVKERVVEEGYLYFDWNVSGEDSVGEPTKASILKNIKKDLTRYEEPVILLHDGGSNDLTAEVLPEVIKYIKKQGYVFDVLDHRNEVLHY